MTRELRPAVTAPGALVLTSPTMAAPTSAVGEGVRGGREVTSEFRPAVTAPGPLPLTSSTMAAPTSAVLLFEAGRQG